MAVARALISKPAVVFADEPSGNLDSKASGDVLELLRHAVDDFGQTVVMVTHDAHAASFADRLLVLADGQDRPRRGRGHGRAGARPHEVRRLMLALVLRGFLQRKLRVLLTGIAIALGVALMAGTYVLTDTINNSFAGIFQIASRGESVVVTPAQTLGRNTASQTSPITDAMLASVRATPGVAQAAGGIFAVANFLDAQGKRLTSGGAPAFVASEVPARFEPFKPVKGRFPAERAARSRSTKRPPNARP